MSTSHILYDITDRIGTITLNRPDVMNALGGTMREDILARLQDSSGRSRRTLRYYHRRR